MNRATDQELLVSYARAGSDPAFAQLVERHVDLVYSTALRLVVDHHLAEDVTQSVFVALARSAAKLQHCRSLAGWLHATTRNQAVVVVRREARRRVREREAVDMNSNDVAEAALWTQMQPWLDLALSQLASNDRELILLRYFQRKTAREIAGVLCLSEDAAQKRLSRALERLRIVLARHGVSGSAAALGVAMSGHMVLAAPAGLAGSVASHIVSLGLATTTAGTASGIIAQQALYLMATKKLFTAGTIILLGLAVVPLVMRPRERATQTYVQFEPATLPSRAGVQISAPFRWSDLESRDYRQYIANLRSSGAPEQLIRDTVSLEIYRIYLPKLRAIWAERQGQERPYWQKQLDEKLSPDQWKRLRDVLDDCGAVLVSLFGPGARMQDALNVITCQPDFYSLRLAWLPDEPRAKAGAILEAFDSTVSALGHREESQTEVEERQEKRIAALRDVLTPAELDEFRLREDPNASIIRMYTRYSDLTPDEFSKLVKTGHNQLLVGGLTLNQQKENQARLAKVLGAERAAAVLKTSDLTYAAAREWAETLGLPIDVAERAWELKWEAIAAHDQLVKAQELPADARQKQLTELESKMRLAFVELLGPDGFRQVRRDGAWWEVIKRD